MPTTPWDDALDALEWGKVVSRLCAHASSDPGRERCAALSPGTDLDAIRISLEENRDGRRMLIDEGPLPLDGLKEIAPPVEKAGKGSALSTAELLLVGQTARTGERTRRFFEDRRGRYPRLSHHAKGIPPLRDLADEIEDKIDGSGNVLDRASPSLGGLRRQLQQIRNRLQKTADEIIASPRFARHVQEAYVTVRSGRLVIPFKIAAKGLFPGIVHDTSQSGQTVFFEPEELVYLNNEVKMAEIEVEREIARILAELSGKVARRSDDLLRCRAILTQLDFLQARCLLAEELSAAEPTVNASGEVALLSARHPLMVLSHKEVVPNDLKLGRPFRCLILTGPNAGGKTVALKTLGLLTLMAMAGLSVSAAGDSTVSTFPRVFASMGDEQSVERDLSTYSAHVRRLNEILAGADRGSLVLLDEVVSGTDPREGAAIARGFLEVLADREVRVLATTHFEELKGIAFADRRFENGSMEFDPAALRPTYRLRLGVPGRSMAMEIARGLGFPEEVLSRAKRYLTGQEQKLDEVLARLERERERLGSEAAALAAKRGEAEEEKRLLAALRERAREEESKALEKGRQRIRDEVRKAEGTLRAVTEELRRERKIETVRKASTVLREWKEKARIAEEDPVVRAMMSRTAPLPPGAVLYPGQKVFLSPLHKEGEVSAPAGPEENGVEVLVGGMKTRVPREQVRIFAADRRPAGATAPGTARRAEERSAEVFFQTPGNTLDLRGMYLDEALPEVDAFLDRLSLAQTPHAFLIHGHGTGALKAGVRRHLKSSPYAKRFFPAPREQGGDGATIVVLS
ncbi:MAG TPA: Smr/MutS family protein [Candidatus Deferrimicrobiaceae bacterium]|nr:Smr/MutS family protein [Candidatus Deferrimicrobiaceae bacterium]